MTNSSFATLYHAFSALVNICLETPLFFMIHPHRKYQSDPGACFFALAICATHVLPACANNHSHEQKTALTDL